MTQNLLKRKIGYDWDMIHVYAKREFESRSWQGVLDTTLYNTVDQRFALGKWFSKCTTKSNVWFTQDSNLIRCLILTVFKI